MHVTPAQKTILLDTDRASIAYGLSEKKPLEVVAGRFEPRLRALGASFVTLTIGQALRGCIGSLDAIRPLIVDVAQQAYAAAFCDPRFPPLCAEELAQLTIHASILSPSRPVSFESDEMLADALRPGIDGLIVVHGQHRATFLPAVWQSIPDRHQFIRHLKRKAGIPDAVQDYQARRYTAIAFSSGKEP
jgi:AmmeMemoRadiSam system protein A